MMTKKLKMAALGAVAAVGLASAGAFAQQAETQRTPANPQMNQGQMNQGMRDGAMMGNGMMGMMNDPEMRRQMSEMMSNCNRMMERMGNMSGMGQPRT